MCVLDLRMSRPTPAACRQLLPACMGSGIAILV
jgi:hypothetical protein